MRHEFSLMVSRWMDGDSDFQAPLKALVRRLAKRKATFYVSAVTVQELMVFARASGAHQKAHGTAVPLRGAKRT